MWLNYNETYAVSDDGLIMNRKRGNILKPYINIEGRHCVCIDRQKRLVHHLVADRFLPKPTSEDLEIDHINRDKGDNSAYNLRWVNRSVNLRNNSSKNIYIKTTHVRGHTYVRWAVQFSKNRKAVFCKQFKTLEEATAAREEFINSEEYRLSM